MNKNIAWELQSICSDYNATSDSSDTSDYNDTNDISD